MGKKVRTLSEEQREKLRAFIKKTTVRVSEGAFGDKTYKEIIAEGKSAEELKEMSVREFTKAARIYESGHAGIYEICKDDHPQMLAELETEPFGVGFKRA